MHSKEGAPNQQEQPVTKVFKWHVLICKGDMVSLLHELEAPHCVM